MSGPDNFAVNGRFLTQTPTGVQRYAHNVLGAMDNLLDSDNALPLFVPNDIVDPGFRSIKPVILPSVLPGQAWEQLVLSYHCPDLLLNLCNTAPALKSQQIVCIHDANVFAAPESYSPAFRMLYKTMQPAIVKRSLRIASVSNASARQIARYLPIDAKDIVILPNGFEHALSWNHLAAQKAPAIVADIQARSRRYVFVLGSNARHKNLALLAEACDALDALGIDLVIAGGNANIFSASQKLQQKNVVMTGRVSDDDLSYFLKHALCLVFPSFNEGFGLPIVEAMALGCPVISSGFSSMAEVCGNAALLASPFETRQWIDHISALNASAFLADDMRARGFRQVRNFSWKATAEGYRELIDNPSAGLSRYRASARSMMRVAVVVATRGRPAVVTQTVKYLLETQTVAPDCVIVSTVERADAGNLLHDPRVTVITGKMGLPTQRNNGLAHLPKGIDVVVFFDDDFVADPGWLATALTVFCDESRVVGFTGRVVADGIKGAGITFEDAVSSLKQKHVTSGPAFKVPYSPYGCNMAFRMSAIGKLRFDERLVMYGWLEDRDFGATVAADGGQLVKSALAYGVHMGAKTGRVSGDRLGYSQVVNPVYLHSKGTMTTGQMLAQIWRNVSINLARFLRPEPFIDRRGRVRGNLIGFADVLRGRINPERACELKPAGNSLKRLTKERLNDG